MTDNVFPFLIEQVKPEPHNPKQENKKKSGGGTSGGDMNNFVTREELRDELRELRNETHGLRDEFRADFKSLKKEIWVATITSIGIAVGAMYGIVQTTIAAIDAGRASAQAQQPQQPPIIINVPSAAPTLAPQQIRTPTEKPSDPK